jgi:anti-sigma factor RsiW
MEHSEVKSLRDAYLDAEVDPLARLEIDAHLEGCASCRADLAAHRNFSAVLRAEADYFEAPADLAARLGAGLRPVPRPVTQRWQHLAMAASLALAVVLAGGVGYFAGLSAPEGQLLQDVVDGHVRSLQVDHLTDVASSDRHTVKPWFNGRLDSSPPARDFARDGFPLIGGRLDYLDGRPVAALVYRHRLHPINLFVWPDTDGVTASASMTRQGYNVRHWGAGGMSYWLVSDVDMSELKTLEELLRQPQE